MTLFLMHTMHVVKLVQGLDRKWVKKQTESDLIKRTIKIEQSLAL